MYLYRYIYLSIFPSIYLYLRLSFLLSLSLSIYIYIYTHRKREMRLLLTDRGRPSVCCLQPRYISMYISIYLYLSIHIYLSESIYIHLYRCTCAPLTRDKPPVDRQMPTNHEGSGFTLTMSFLQPRGWKHARQLCRDREPIYIYIYDIRTASERCASC